jgi:hypothetical protein
LSTHNDIFNLAAQKQNSDIWYRFCAVVPLNTWCTPTVFSITASINFHVYQRFH